MKKHLKKIKKCSINIYNGNNIYKREGVFMLKNNIKKIILSLIAILLVIVTGYTVFATDEGQPDWYKEMEQGNWNIDNNGNVEHIPEGTDANTNTNTNTNTNSNEKRPATTPHAGLEDYTGLIFVAIFAVSAVYAYKKVKEYNG